MPRELVARQAYQHSVVPDARSVGQLVGYLKKEVQQIERSGPHISIQTQSIDYLVSGNDEIVLMDTTAGPLSATLPVRIDETLNMSVTIKNVGGNTLTIVGTVDGVLDPTLTLNQAMTIASDAVKFYKVGEVL